MYVCINSYTNTYISKYEYLNLYMYRYLDSSTKAPLLLAVETGLLTPHITFLVDRGLGPLLDAIGTTGQRGQVAPPSDFPPSSSSSSSFNPSFSSSASSRYYIYVYLCLYTYIYIYVYIYMYSWMYIVYVNTYLPPLIIIIILFFLI
jgi:hypothetical protein